MAVRKKLPRSPARLPPDPRRGREPHAHNGLLPGSAAPRAGRALPVPRVRLLPGRPPAVSGILAATDHPNLHLLTYNEAYARRWGRTSLYTPMVVADGGAGGGGGGLPRRDRGRGGARQKLGVYVDANESGVKIDSDRLEAESHDVLVMVYEDRSETVKIPKGPDKGKKVVHRDLVRDMVKVGEWARGKCCLATASADGTRHGGRGARAGSDERADCGG
ncbi:DUF1223-domain-containing protein [Biscogniauxia mediterranea]|nr:DUF1223-domain-containing protein [Biscogniauxia mediterranea]